MDEETVKLTLSAYRPGTSDERDPHFAEALRAVESDPALGAWFAEAQQFDAIFAAKVRAAPVAPALRDRLAPHAGIAPSRRRPAYLPWLAAAATVVAAFILGRFSGGRPPALPAGGNGSLALQAISYSGHMPPLDFVCFSSEAVKGWVDKKSAGMQMGRLLDKPVPNMQMIGSSAMRWDGKPVIMVALQSGQRMGMLYLVRAADFPQAAGEAGQIMEKDGWISETGRRGDRVFVLTTRGTRNDLNFPMPL